MFWLWRQFSFMLRRTFDKDTSQRCQITIRHASRLTKTTAGCFEWKHALNQLIKPHCVIAGENLVDYHTVSVDVDARHLTRWYDRSRWVGEFLSTLITSVPLQKQCSNVCKGGDGGTTSSSSSSRSAWRTSGRHRRQCAQKCFHWELLQRQPRRLHITARGDWMLSTTLQINFSWDRAPWWTEYNGSGLRKTVTLKNGKIISSFHHRWTQFFFSKLNL